MSSGFILRSCQYTVALNAESTVTREAHCKFDRERTPKYIHRDNARHVLYAARALSRLIDAMLHVLLLRYAISVQLSV